MESEEFRHATMFWCGWPDDRGIPLPWVTIAPRDVSVLGYCIRAIQIHHCSDEGRLPIEP